MKKTIFALLALFLCLIMFGCGATTPKDETPVTNAVTNEPSIDERFLSSLVAGLNARWILTTADSGALSITKHDWEEYLQAEYDQIKSYENETFENDDLGRWAKQYIQSIKGSFDALKYYGSDMWDNVYKYGVYEDRVVAIYHINKLFPLSVSPEYQSNLESMLTVGEAIDSIPSILEDIKFQKEYDSVTKKTTYYTYLENPTAIEFSNFTFRVKLKDSSGTVFQTYEPYAILWKPGEEYRFTFTTPLNFASFEIEHVRAWYK